MNTFELPENCTPIDAGQVKVGHYIILKNRPCKIYECYHHKNGKHGKAKVSLVAIDLLNGKKCEGSLPAKTSMAQFQIDKEEYQLINVEEEALECLDINDAQHNIAIDP